MSDFSHRTILITGGTGSFGRTMSEQLLADGVKELRLFSRDEEKQHHMRHDIDDPRAKFIIGDIRDRSSVNRAMRGVDFVFHAAALKQVPSCDFFPLEAVQTNIVGSGHVVRAAIEAGVSRVVCLSTDKAVYPVNAMGMSKALMEKVALAAAREIGPEGPTIISSVRYGNVMCSRGSVIPLFMKQIKKGQPITVTDAKMTRFMMPLRDAVALVEFAFQHADQGDLFIKKAPSCSLDDLVAALKNLFGRPDAEVREIGVRHGEKMWETLASATELHDAEDMGDYYRLPMDNRDLNYGKYYTEGETEIAEAEDLDSHKVTLMSVQEIEDLLMTLPEVRAQLEGWPGAKAGV